MKKLLFSNVVFVACLTFVGSSICPVHAEPTVVSEISSQCVQGDLDASKPPLSNFSSPVSGMLAPRRIAEDMLANVGGVYEIEIEVSGLAGASGMLVADGQTLIPVRVSLLDVCKRPVKGIATVRIKADGVKIVSAQEKEIDTLIDPAGKSFGVKEIEVTDGYGSFEMVAPDVAQKVTLSVRVGDQMALGEIAFAPDLRPLIAVGVIDGVFTLKNQDQGSVPAAGINDGFESELKRFQAEFDHGDKSLAGRVAFFVKGAIKGTTLLTAAFDSEKESRQNTLKNINPDKYYPVMGDASTKGMEARSSDRLYVRLDNGRNYVLYGDATTFEGFSDPKGLDAVSVRNLGLYNRSITGFRGHLESDEGQLDTFVVYDSLRQAVEEYRGNGTTGPYSVANLYAVENSEKLEIVVRDRNNTSRIISIAELTRYLDYTFEPFSGRILLKTPLPSIDESLNPVSLRITYEVDTGGESFWIYGLSGQKWLTPWIQVGGNFVKDENPARPSGAGYVTVPGQGSRELRELFSANASISTSDTGTLVVEVANVKSATVDNDIWGSAFRLDWTDQGDWNSPWGQELPWDARIFLGVSEKDFHNPASSYTDGRSEAGLNSVVGLAERTTLVADLVHTEDKIVDTWRDAQAVHLEYKVGERWTLAGGVRHIKQSEGAVLSFSSSSSYPTLSGQASVYGGSGLNPAGAGFWGTNVGLDPVTGQPQSMLNGQLIPGTITSPALDAVTLQTGATYRYNEKLSLGAEVGHDDGFEEDPLWAALSAQYRTLDWKVFGRAEAPTGRSMAGASYSFSEHVDLYGRFESANGLASGYALDSGADSRAFVLGLKQHNKKGMENFSEFRIRDGMSGRESENATGLRNTFSIQPNLKANVAAEHLSILSGGGRSATAMSGGLEWSENLWRGETRLEWRQLERSPTAVEDDTADSWLNTLSLARKIDTAWTGLFKNYLLLTNQQDSAGHQLQNRLQVGLAYRPAHRNDFDALLRYENKYENNQEIDPREKRVAHILSTNINYHPDRAWWCMGRIAGKSVKETLAGVEDDYLAWLLSGRVIIDLPKNFDLGVLASVMGSPSDNTRQYAYGVEGGYLLGSNIWGSLGYNLSGFRDDELTGSDYTSKGAYLRLRIKF